MYDSLRVGPQYVTKSPEIEKFIYMYDKLVVQEKFFSPNKPGSLRLSIDPEKPPNGYFFCYASVYRDAYS